MSRRLHDLKSELLVSRVRHPGHKTMCIGFVVHVVLSKIPGAGLGRWLVGDFAARRVNNRAFAAGIPTRPARLERNLIKLSSALPISSQAAA